MSRSERVVIGMDPHKRSATIKVMSSDETILGTGRFSTDRDAYAAMVRHTKRGRTTSGRSRLSGNRPAHRHPAARRRRPGHRCPAKLSARARVFATGQGRETDATDALSSHGRPGRRARMVAW